MMLQFAGDGRLIRKYDVVDIPLFGIGNQNSLLECVVHRCSHIRQLLLPIACHTPVLALVKVPRLSSLATTAARTTFDTDQEQTLLGETYLLVGIAMAAVPISLYTTQYHACNTKYKNNLK